MKMSLIISQLTEVLEVLDDPVEAVERRVLASALSQQHLQRLPVEVARLVEDDELGELVVLLQGVLGLLQVAVVVLQPEQGRHQSRVGLATGTDTR